MSVDFYEQLLEEIARLQGFAVVADCARGEGPCHVFGVQQQTAAFIAAAALKKTGGGAIITADEQTAQETCEQLRLFMPTEYLPPKQLQLAEVIGGSRELECRRVAALYGMLHGAVAVMSAEAAMQSAAPPLVFANAVTNIAVGDTIDTGELCRKLVGAGYEREEKVESAGQFRFAGGILDVFPPEREEPLRFEFFDDEVDSIREYDSATQRSIRKLQEAVIMPACEAPVTQEAAQRAIAMLKKKHNKAGELAQRGERLTDTLEFGGVPSDAYQLLPLFYQPVSVLDYIDSPAIFVVEPNAVDERANAVYEHFTQGFASRLEESGCFKEQFGLLFSPDELTHRIDTKKTTLLFSFTRSYDRVRAQTSAAIELRAAPAFTGEIKLLGEELMSMKKLGTAAVIYAGARAARLCEALRDFDVPAATGQYLNRPPVRGEILVLPQSLAFGCESSAQKLCVLSETEVYGRQKRKTKPVKKRSVNKLDIFADLKIGDYVVHETFGIGVFKGFETKRVDGIDRDYMNIAYSGTDRLYVPVSQLDGVQKFIGAADRPPKLNKLGGKEWTKTVSRVASAVKELAIDLVKLYSERRQKQGFRFSRDTEWQRQLEDAFEYQETPDQLQCIEDIKRDMESGVVMDRLLCGDVGYGKTEVAIRAAFKAVQDGKQVAILVPTTVLAQQHYEKLRQRFDGFAVDVEQLSRFRTPAQQKETIKRLLDGRCDVVVGTHRLLNKDIKYKDLGLLVIDEEQRFGVGHKETIKELKTTVDVLTLSATPIPRTLHMAMTGIRDMSVIETPPDDRYPVQTYVIEYSEAVVREAILRETARDGQVFFLYNRVSGMEKFTAELRELVPEATFGMAHGQMSERELEDAMMSFMNREFSVLVCSTIIESGLDIGNANTLIVYDSDRLGLSQLYQIRGRVGRTNRLAYAYMTFRRNKAISEVAQKRLNAIREFTEFGSGFKIAMRDLEIRGAGNLLGAQQHGHMDDVGYDMYCRMIEQAVNEAMGRPGEPEIDTVVDVPISATIPAGYITDEEQRLETYKRIASINSREGLYDVQEEIEDRFGDIPQNVQNLMEVSLLRASAKRAQLTHLFIPADCRQIKLTFHPAASVDGASLLELVTTTPGAKLINGGQALLLTQNPPTVRECMNMCETLIASLRLK